MKQTFDFQRLSNAHCARKSPESGALPRTFGENEKMDGRSLEGCSALRSQSGTGVCRAFPASPGNREDSSRPFRSPIGGPSSLPRRLPSRVILTQPCNYYSGVPFSCSSFSSIGGLFPAGFWHKPCLFIGMKSVFYNAAGWRFFMADPMVPSKTCQSLRKSPCPLFLRCFE
jgi:hypothetical protein